MAKIGIFSGTFDPVHAGHISFALKALKEARLETVYFLPERNPRRKEGVTHYAHRVAMLKLALRPYPKLRILELPDKQFSVAKTLPRLKKRFDDAALFQLIGSDAIELLASHSTAKEWPGFDSYMAAVRLVVGIRIGVDEQKIRKMLSEMQAGGQIVSGHMSSISSRAIRRAVNQGKIPEELLSSLRTYVKKHWLYASIEGVDANSSL